MKEHEMNSLAATMSGRDQVLRAVQRTADGYAGGVKALALAMGLQHKTLLNKINPNQESHNLTLLETLRLMEESQDTRIMDALADTLGGQFIRAPEMGQHDPKLMQDLAEMTARFGELVREVAIDIADDEISNNELQRIEEEADQLRAALARLLADLRRINGKLSPRHERSLTPT